MIALTTFLLTAVLVFLGNGLTPLWPVMWLAPMPVLWFALRRPAWQAGLVAGGAWLMGSLNLWNYFHLLGIPPLGWLASFGAEAVVFAGGVLLMRALVMRHAIGSAWLALPSLWAGFEFLASLTPNGTAGDLAYSQLNFLQFLQTASLTGPWGMSFVLMLLPTGLVLSYHLLSRERRLALKVLTATVGIVGALLVFGTVRMALPQSGPHVRVGLIASDANGGAAVEPPGSPTDTLLSDYAVYARQLITKGAQVIVMPEHVGVVRDNDVAYVDGLFQPIADQTHAVLVIGVARISTAGKHNQARVYLPNSPVLTYNKEHLLPGFETTQLSAGTKRLYFDAPKGTAGPEAASKWGVEICKDMDFTEPSWRYGNAGVGLMLVPAWDFSVDGLWHGHLAVMRAVENGFSLVRAAREGLLTAADEYGRILAEKTSNAGHFATLIADVPVEHQQTLFQILGDWFGWFSLGLLAFVLGRLWLGPRTKGV